MSSNTPTMLPATDSISLKPLNRLCTVMSQWMEGFVSAPHITILDFARFSDKRHPCEMGASAHKLDFSRSPATRGA
jgi:hypothetical protein